MVGVANSTGCTTCRSRKVKCDLQRPSCEKCIKAGRECGGYKRDRVFIIGTQEDHGRCSSHPKRGPLVPKSSNKRSLHPSNSSVSTGSRTSLSPSNASFTCSNGTSLSRRSSFSPQPLVQPAFANLRQLIAQNAEDFLMPPMFESDPRSNVPSLLDYLHLMAEQNVLFNRGILAFCLASAGKKKDDFRLNNASFKMSMEAMREMRTALFDSRQFHSIEVVAATICMSDCEIMLNQAQGESDLQYYNWRGLVRGTATLVQERGPLSFAQYPDFQLFTRQFRGNGVLEAIGRRQHTFLAGEDWCTLPWSKGIIKTMIDSCFDIMAGMAGVLADVDMVLGISTHGPVMNIAGSMCELEPTALLTRLFELENAFTLWFGNLQQERDNLCHIVLSEDEASRRLFPLEIRFPNFRIGMLHMYMWASLILIYDATEKLHSFVEQQRQQTSMFHIYTPPTTPPTPPLHFPVNHHYHHHSPFPPSSKQTIKNTHTQHNNVRIFSRNILQSLNPLLSTARAESWSVVHMLAFPLWIVMQCYENRSVEEEGFLRKFMGRMVGEGICFVEPLCAMSFEEYARS